jgi:hypothetical protein
MNQPLIKDPNEGIVTMDLDPKTWAAMPTQGKILMLIHSLIDLAAMPHFSFVQGLRVQVKEPDLLIPREVVCHIGKRGNQLAENQES